MKNNWKMLALGLLLASLAAFVIQIDGTIPPVDSGPLPTSHSLFFEESGEPSPGLGSILVQRAQSMNGAPTVSGLFQTRPGVTPFPTSTPKPTLTPLPQPSRTPEPTLTAHPSPTPAPQPTQVSEEYQAEVFIFDDELDSNWLVYEPSGMAFDLQSGPAYTGRYAIEAVPETASSTLLFAVRPYPQEHYTRREVLAISFMLYNADGFLGASDLSAAVLGSNSFYSYVRNDVSVHPDGARVFTLSPLEDLVEGAGALEGSWVEVTVWLDDLFLDPEYQFVTGFYLKNLSGSEQPLRIDEVRLILAGRN